MIRYATKSTNNKRKKSRWIRLHQHEKLVLQMNVKKAKRILTEWEIMFANPL